MSSFGISSLHCVSDTKMKKALRLYSLDVYERVNESKEESDLDLRGNLGAKMARDWEA